MKNRVKFIGNNVDRNDAFFDYETVDTCPICKAKISPTYVASSFDSVLSASVFDLCNSCNSAFITKYEITISSPSPRTYRSTKVIYSEPNRFEKKKFDDRITALSPQFDKIYNQALAAETFGLDEIAGLGFRKSLEFLIKDFAIHQHPDDSEDIKKLMLSPCIQKYISAEHIKTLAERSAWIGNDEAHYVRKQADRDVSDMKSFIQATVYFIGMILITEDAATMTSVK